MQGQDTLQREEKRIITKGGFKAAIVNGQVIRLSEVVRRLKEDGETYDEYKVRQKLIKKLKSKVIVKPIK